MDITEQDYSSLVDAQISVDVLLGSTDIDIRKFLSLGEGDIVALYYGYGGLETGEIKQIKNHRAKVEVTYSNGVKVMSKWKYGECMVKL
jgi:hypothetical protein